ncbi:MAG TPA: O-methyltransferase [Actinomycetota bacterium]
MPITDPDVARYMRGLLDRHDEDVLVEMEKLAEEKRFPIVNRHVGVTLEILTRIHGARRIFELGSGYGYSAYWFARGAGPDAEIHCTDGDAENAKAAEDFLGRAGLWDRITYHVGDAVTSFDGVEGEWDVVYDDIDKDGYPAAWRAASGRIRLGGLYICDNVLWGGQVAGHAGPDGMPGEWTEAIKEHNSLIANDERYVSSILPIRDGVMLALRVA